MTDAFSVAGWVLMEGELVEGHVRVEGGVVVAVEASSPPEPPLVRGLVLPGLVNAHTHVGDAAVPPPPPEMGPADIFPPPGGYKHRMLASMPPDRLDAGISSYLDSLTAAGTVEHADFREGGVAGIELLRRAREGAAFPPRSRVFGRPASLAFDPVEMGQLLAMVDGIGLSAVRDWPREPLRDVVAAARDVGLPVALHCSESAREDLSPVLDMEPLFLVHMVFGTPQDFRDLAAARVPVVVCPRSTARFTRPPPVVEMVRAGVDVRVGTDNAMLQGPSVLDDLALLWSIPEVEAALDPVEMLGWVVPPAKGSNTKGGIGVSAGSRDLAVLTPGDPDPLAFLRSPRGPSAELVMTGGRIWRR